MGGGGQRDGEAERQSLAMAWIHRGKDWVIMDWIDGKTLDVVWTQKEFGCSLDTERLWM